MKRLLAIMLVALLGLTINPLDWESKFNEQQDQITALETENEQLRSELDTMANYLMTQEEKAKVNNFTVVYTSNVLVDVNLFASKKIVDISNCEIGDTFWVEFYVKIENTTSCSGGIVYWLDNITSFNFIEKTITKASMTFNEIQKTNTLNAGDKALVIIDLTAVDNLIIKVEGVYKTSGTSFALYMGAGQNEQSFTVLEAVIKATKLD
jgi:hypothetical protein